MVRRKKSGLVSRLTNGGKRIFRSIGQAIGGMRFQGYGGQGYNWRLLLPGSQYDYEAAAGDLWRNSAVACCLRWLEDNFPEPMVEVVTRLPDGKDEVIEDHGLVELLHRPNPFWDRYQFFAACVLSFIVDGNCYIRKVRSGAGKVVQLWWIPHWLIFPRWSTDGTQYIGWYDYEVNGARERIPLEDIIHWRQGIDPRDDRKGYSKVKANVRAICGLNEADTYTSAILRNMGIVGAVVSFDGDDGIVDGDQIDILRDQWREDHTSEGRGTPLFSPRNMKVQKLGMSPEEMRLDKIPARLEDQIHSAIGLSPMVTGAASGKDHKTYANYGEARQAAYEDCLLPMHNKFASCLTWNLLKTDFAGGDRIRFNYSEVKCLQENQTEVAERIGKQYQIYQTITRAEAREMQGLDWDEEDEVYFTEASMRATDEADYKPEEDEDEGATELGGKSVKATVKAGKTDPDGAGSDRGREHRHPFDDRARTPGTPPGDIDGPEEDNTWNLPDGQPIRRDLKRWFTKQRKTILGTIPEIGYPLPATFPPLTDYTDPMASAMTPLISGYWDEAGKVTRAKLGLDPDKWEVHDPHLHQTISEATLEFCAETNATTTRELNDALRELHKELIAGLVESGDSIAQLTKRVQAVFTNAEKFRAERIARTETSRAVHSASIRSAAESEVVSGKKWLLSANSCDQCVAIAHRMNTDFPSGIPLDREFGTFGMNPTYSSIKFPPLHPNCRCSMTYVLTDEYEQLLAEHGPPEPETFENGSLGPEPKARKIGKPKPELVEA